MSRAIADLLFLAVDPARKEVRKCEAREVLQITSPPSWTTRCVNVLLALECLGRVVVTVPERRQRKPPRGLRVALSRSRHT